VGVYRFHIGVITELRSEIDRFEHLGDDLVANGRLNGTMALKPNGNPTVTGEMSDRNRLRPSRRASHVPRVRNSWFSWPPIDTTGTIGTPAARAALT
jgi:hypothetical protein